MASSQRAFEVQEPLRESGLSRPKKFMETVSIALGLCALVAVVARFQGPREQTSQGQVHAETSEPELTFAQFVHKFGRSYAPESKEYARREALFQQAQAEIQATNARNAQEGQPWRAGVSPFMDWSTEERMTLRGYRKPSRLLGAALRVKTNPAYPYPEGLPESQTGGWSKEDGPLVRSQGGCGSCWAFASAEAAEAQLLKQHPDVSPAELRLSEQALVSCVLNPDHCGGGGGCEGATMELAYDFMRDHGIPFEADLEYQASNQNCVQSPLNGSYPAETLAKVGGWRALPSNEYGPLMWELYLRGPVGVAVAADWWDLYFSGIFTCTGSMTVINHAVLAKGYGVGEDMFGRPLKYWLIQNSWGPDWGEMGHIRLRREENEQSKCGVDRDTSIGLGCDGDNKTTEVCGACGVLFDPVVPVDVVLTHAGVPNVALV